MRYYYPVQDGFFFPSNPPAPGTCVPSLDDGSGTPADGIAFSWGSSNSIPDTANFGEGGQGDGVTVSIISYAGAGAGPSFNILYRGSSLVRKYVPYSLLNTSDLNPNDPLQQYATMVIRVKENGTLDLQYKNVAIFAALPLPGFTPIAGGRFGLGARTGGKRDPLGRQHSNCHYHWPALPIPLEYRLSRRFTTGHGHGICVHDPAAFCDGE